MKKILSIIVVLLIIVTLAYAYINVQPMSIIGNLESSVAYYAGCRDWKEFRRKVKFLEISQQGWEESKTRVNFS